VAGLVSNAGSKAWPASDPRGIQNGIKRRSMAVLVIPIAPSFQGDEVRREAMDIGIPPFREHVDMPLQWIGDYDLRDRIVSGKAAVRAVWLSESNDEGGDVIKISRYGLPRRGRDCDSRRRHLRRCRARRPATTPPAASARHDQLLRSHRLTRRADPAEVSA